MSDGGPTRRERIVNTRTLLAAAVLLAATGAGGGCAQPLYDWGSYEPSVAHFYANRPEAVDKDRAKLIGEVNRTQADGKRVPPGKMAHIGYLCLLSGDRAAASTWLAAEKQAYPESAKLVDAMMRRM